MLSDTKERALPRHQAQSLEDYLVYLKHIALYDFAARYCHEKIVLDLGCGEGYGSDRLAQSARFVVAADYAPDAVAHAQKKYARENLAFVVCDAERLPFRKECFDVAISYEVIEHIENVQAYLMEIKRACRAMSVCLISTPNRLMRLLPFQKPWNRFHKREYDLAGLRQELTRVFSSVEMRGVTAIPAIIDIERRRVKQNPFVAYPRMLAHMFVPLATFDRIKPKKSGAEMNPSGLNGWNFSWRDFEITPDGLRECITLVALCG